MAASGLLDTLWWQGLGKTMLDFLMWGSVLGSILWLASVLLLRRASAQTRYRYFGSSLILMVVTGFALLADEFESHTGHRQNTETSRVTGSGNPLAGVTPVTSSSLPLPASAEVSGAVSLRVQIQRPWLHYLPFLWIGGSALVLVMTGVGMIGGRRLQRSSGPATSSVQEMSDRLAGDLQLSRPVRVMLCQRVLSPLQLGWWRPLILLPPAVISGCSVRELEMILIHELQHVKRWDNLVNLGQRLAECLFCFHPFVWYFSHAIRTERECCCDNAVVARGWPQTDYARLLQKLAEGQDFMSMSLRMGAAEHALVARIRRLMNSCSGSVSIIPVLMLGMALMVAVGVMQAQEPNRPPALVPIPAAFVTETFTVPEDLAMLWNGDLKGKNKGSTIKQMLEERGVTFGEGAAVFYIGTKNTLTVRNTPSQVRRVEALVEGWMQKRFAHVNIRFEAVWTDAATGERSELVVPSVVTLSGQRARVEITKENILPSSKREGGFDSVLSGLIFEIDPQPNDAQTALISITTTARWPKGVSLKNYLNDLKLQEASNNLQSIGHRVLKRAMAHGDKVSVLEYEDPISKCHLEVLAELRFINPNGIVFEMSEIEPSAVAYDVFWASEREQIARTAVDVSAFSYVTSQPTIGSASDIEKGRFTLAGILTSEQMEVLLASKGAAGSSVIETLQDAQRKITLPKLTDVPTLSVSTTVEVERNMDSPFERLITASITLLGMRTIDVTIYDGSCIVLKRMVEKLDGEEVSELVLLKLDLPK